MPNYVAVTAFMDKEKKLVGAKCVHAWCAAVHLITKRLRCRK